ncbi:MAG: hypothetical protein AAFU73_21155 [Planctomycetota bacterium]
MTDPEFTDPRKSHSGPDPDTLARRAEELRREVAARVEDQRRRLYADAPRKSVGAGPRMRLVLLSAFVIVMLAWAGRNSGGPLGLQAAFTPASDGVSFAGRRTFEAQGDAVTLVPGDVVGARDGRGASLVLGDGRLELEPGARAAVASLMPPRARLLGGTVRASGRIRVVSAHGILDLEGEAELRLDQSGLAVGVRAGEATVVSPDGSRTLAAGESALFQ